MGKLTVESIINIYGSGVKEIKTYNEAKRAKTEEFLQVEPVAFSLSDEPDVLRIYIDKESAAASLDGTLKEDTAKFEAGKTYYSRSICDHECIFTIEVVKRTEKSVTYIYDGRQRRSMIKTDENGEYIKPDRYSMAPTFRAERLYEGLKKYKVKADCLVDEGWVTWEIEAENEEAAWEVGYGLALHSNVADSGTVEVEEITEEQAEEPQDTEGKAEEIAKAIVDGIGKDLAAALVEYYNLVKQLAEDIPGYKLRDTREIKKLLADQLPEWDEEDWEDLRESVEAESQRNAKERKRMKQYTVYYIIKANRREWLHKMEVERR